MFWLRVRAKLWRLRHLHSPLRLRGSIVRLRRHHRRPILALLRLMNPFPTWKFPVLDEPAPAEMLGNRRLEAHRRAGVVNLQSIPLWSARDTPLRSLYRMYETIACGEYASLGTETEYFWHQRRWSLESVRDPQDHEPVRYAILACLAEELVVAFNWRLSLGMRRNRKNIPRTETVPWPPYTPVRGPSWTKSVPALSLDDLRGLPTDYVTDGKLILETGGLSEVFANRNIVTNVGWLYTV